MQGAVYFPHSDARTCGSARGFSPSLLLPLLAACGGAPAAQNPTFPHMVALTGVAIALTLLSFTFLGDGLRDTLDLHAQG